MSSSKVMTEAGAIERFLPPKAIVAVGGMHSHNNPMALVREVVRRGRPVRTLVTSPSASINADVLIGAGLVEETLAPYIGFEHLGLAPCFRRAAENGSIKVRECETSLIVNALRAGAAGIPFTPVAPGVESTSIPDLNPQDYRWMKDPFTEAEVLCTRALNPDVALVHCKVADQQGNAVFGGSVFSDWDMVRASKRVILMVEKVVEHEDLIASAPSSRDVPTSRFIPGFFVSAVVPAIYGCHPTSSHGNYFQDESHLKEYLSRAATPEGLKGYLDEYILGTRDQPEYFAKVSIPVGVDAFRGVIVPEGGPGRTDPSNAKRQGPTVVETMICSLARELKDGEVAIMGASSAIPLLACILAKRTHAPDLVYLSGGSGAANPLPEEIPLSSCDQRLLNATSVLELGDLIDGQVLKGADIFFAGGLQVDRNGNLNLIGTGPHDSPDFRGPGTAGLSLFQRTRRIVVYMTGHSTRRFVEKVDHVSGAGRPINNVIQVVTPLGVFDFDGSNRMQISTLNPGVKVDDVIERTGFKVGVPGKEYPVTPTPSEKELGIIRENDPHGKIRDLL